VAVLYYSIGFPRAWSGLSFLGIAGLGGLGPLIFRKDPGTVTCDERDRAINSTAAKAGFGASYMVFYLLGMGTWEIYYYQGGKEIISVHVLPMICMMGGMTAFFAHALTILILYGREKRYE
jgi:hypothetical protein